MIHLPNVFTEIEDKITEEVTTKWKFVSGVSPIFVYTSIRSYEVLVSDIKTKN